MERAQKVKLGLNEGNSPDFDLIGEIGEEFEEDWYEFSGMMGDTVGIAVLAIDEQEIDTILSIYDAGGNLLSENDDHFGVADRYPPESPFPAGGLRGDSALTFAVPESGTYSVRVTGVGASTGEYAMQLRLREPAMYAFPSGEKQILYIDFDGVVDLPAEKMFGSGGRRSATLSPFMDFLESWGISLDRDKILQRKIVGNVKRHFDALLTDTAGGISIIGSNEQGDIFGNPNVSRVIVGGSIAELGIRTIGISEFVDPSNQSADDTAIVLLDSLSAPGFHPSSILSLSRSAEFSIEDAVVRVVSSLITHEACHFLGCLHTNNRNDTVSISDSGGFLGNIAGVGRDGIMGTEDDEEAFIADDFYAEEHLGRSDTKQNVKARVIASLAIGRSETLEIRDVLDSLQSRFRYLSEERKFDSFGPNNTRELLDLAPLGEDAMRDMNQFRNRFDDAAKALDSRLK